MYLLTEVKNYFFDRQRVINAVSRKRLRVLSRLGAFIRTRARNSMRKAPAARRRKHGRKIRSDAQFYSAPGQPPFYLEGSLRRFLFFAYDSTTNSVVIGPSGFKNSDVPSLLEYGGVVTRRGRRVTYEPRPYMTPAYEAELKLMPRHLKDLI